MKKNELITAIAEKTGFTKKDSGVFLDAFRDVVIENVVAGEDVRVSELGIFTAIEKGERKARNPQTGEQMIVAAKKVPKFKPSVSFKKIVNE